MNAIWVCDPLDCRRVRETAKTEPPAVVVTSSAPAVSALDREAEDVLENAPTAATSCVGIVA